MFSFLTCLVSLALVSRALADDLLVKLQDGSMVNGHYAETGNREWAGLPFAAPPVGALRWQFPEEPAPLQGTFEADVLAPGCPQICHLPYGSCPETTSEDCLYLSVWAPAKPSEDPAGYPVFFWIHGGAFTQGAGSTPVYNGTDMADRDVVTVIVNYRLGALGYMASESMQGNYGVMDQIRALEWTQANIGGFGGDPSKVTVAGQSAGAESTLTCVTSPMAKGLFHQAIIESNPLALPAHTRESAGKNAKDVFEYLDCDQDDVACMMAKSTDEILTAQKEAPELDLHNLFINFQTFSPMVDATQGPVPRQPFWDMQDGNFPEMNLMAGSMSEEGWLFVMELFPKALSKIEYDGIIRVLFGSRKNKKAVLDMYPYDLVNGKDETDGRNVLNVLGTDLLFYCPLRNATRSFQSAGAQGTRAKPIYEYRFTQLIQEDIWEPSNPYCVGHVCHGSELPFVFNVWSDGGEHVYYPTSAEKDLQLSTANAWANFITNGNPNVGLPVMGDMPAYNGDADAMAVIHSPDWHTESGMMKDACDMWDSLGYYW